ncbi:MAG: hypothetical protein LBH32_10425 [Dysgonamonadaceae bacterium]|jgi:hypothetical protein|nr:hypothetical protein [Dysgonamonadaceae bacterium]
MKKVFIFLIVLYSISLWSQEKDDTNFLLTNAQKDYLYHLSKLNVETILSFKDFTLNDSKKLSLIEKKFNIDLQIEDEVNILFTIQEKCDSAAIQVNVFFVLLKSTDSFIEKSGYGEFFPNKVTLTYKWVLKDNLLIFIFTNRELNHKFQQYVYLPTR